MKPTLFKDDIEDSKNSHMSEFEATGQFTVPDFSDLQMVDFDDKIFSVDTGSVTFDDRYIKPKKTKDKPEGYCIYDNAVKLAASLVPDKDCRYFSIVAASFIFGDFIEAFVTTHNLHVKTMTVSTLGMSQNNVDSFFNIMYGDYVDELNLIVSDYFYSHNRWGVVDYTYQRLDKELGKNNFQYAVAGTHCKMCIFELYDGRKFVMHGSANLSSSANIEQFMIEENADLYDFNYEYQKKIIDEYRTINKSVRVSKLYKIISNG